jgi:hypothetical protein
MIRLVQTLRHIDAHGLAVLCARNARPSPRQYGRIDEQAWHMYGVRTSITKRRTLVISVPELRRGDGPEHRVIRKTASKR